MNHFAQNAIDGITQLDSLLEQSLTENVRLTTELQSTTQQLSAARTDLKNPALKLATHVEWLSGWEAVTDYKDKPLGPWSVVPVPGGALFRHDPTVPYGNIYFFRRMGPVPLRKLVYQVRFQIAEGTRPQAFEFECQQSDGEYTRNFAWQFNPQDGKCYPFDFNEPGGVKKSWVRIPNAPTFDVKAFYAGEPFDVKAVFSCDGAQKTHETLEINGKVYEIGYSDPAPAMRQPAYFNCSVQPDGPKDGKPVAVIAEVHYAVS